MACVVPNTISLLPVSRFELNQKRQQSLCPEVWALLDSVTDPEIPAISLWELGVLQNVTISQANGIRTVDVVLTPTYSGCPALSHMTQDIETLLKQAGFEQVHIETRLLPAWTTDWMEPKTKTKLRDYGIAPPGAPACPQCGSTKVQLMSEFGSTACKALYRCRDCSEPFDYFKPI